MILLPRDWSKHPEARPDFTTKNESFLELAEILRQVGVTKNWFLPLALHDQSLIGVNPHDPDLNPETFLRVVREYCTNPWYAFRECQMVPIDGGDPIPFKINRGVFGLYWSFFNNIDGALEFLRQHGKTIAIASLYVYLSRVLKNARSILITKDPKLRAETIEKMKQIRDALPPGLWVHHKDDPDNQETFASVARGTKLITVIGQNNPASANSQGRGLTAGRLGSDEGPFTNYIRIILPAAFGSGVAARKANEMEGVPYGNFFVTTPGELDSPDGAYMYNLMTSGVNWDERYIDYNSREELLRMMDVNSTAKIPRRIFYIKFNHRQLGTSDEELFEMIRNATSTADQIARDYGGRWTAGRLSSPITEADARILRENKMKPIHKEIFGNSYILNWYLPKEDIAERLESTKHIISLDTSEGVGRDSFAMVMVNPETLETVADSEINEISIIKYCIWLSELMVKYPNTILIIERKSTGSSVADYIIDSLSHDVPNLHKRLFCHITQTKESTSEEYRKYTRGPVGRIDDWWFQFRKEIGFKTDGGKRKLLYGDVLSSAVGCAKRVVRSERLIDQLLSLVVKHNRIDHINSGHDDMVVAWLMAFWFIFLGKNLKFYGINNNRAILRMYKEGDVSLEEEQEMLEEDELRQEKLNEIENLYTLVISTRDTVIRSRYDIKLKKLLTEVKIEISSASTLSDFKELIKTERFKRSMLK